MFQPRKSGIGFYFSVFSLILLNSLFSPWVFASEPNGTAISPTATKLLLQPQEESKSFTLEAVISLALKNYPQIRKAQAELEAAKAGIGIAKSAYLPRLDMFIQNDIGTYNKLPGAFFPELGILPVAGTSPTNQINNFVTGEYSGGLLSWNAYDFGYRHALVNEAKVGVDVAQANRNLTQLDVVSQAISAYLGVQTAQRLVTASEGNLNRMTVFEQSVSTLVQSGLRPGVDESRANADVAVARTQLINAKAQLNIGKAILAEAMGIAGDSIGVPEESFLDIVPGIPQVSPSIEEHPLLMLQQEKISVTQAQEKVLKKSYLPKLYLQAGLNGRGSELDASEKVLGFGQGLYPSRLNYALEANLVFNPFDIVASRASIKQVRFQEEADKAQYDVITQQLLGAFSQAKAQIDASIQVAENTPIEVSAANMTVIQSDSRYRAGLATLVDVSDAQRLLINAQIDDALAKLNVWKALLAAAKAKGDLTPFVQLAKTLQLNTNNSISPITNPLNTIPVQTPVKSGGAP